MIKTALYIAFAGLVMGGTALAQTPDIIPPEKQLPGAPSMDELLGQVEPPEAVAPQEAAPEEIAPEEITPEDKPDYSELTPGAEREARLDTLFERLKDEANPETANLIAEEIWAIWLDSGSASVNFIMRRGIAAQKSGNKKLARAMFDKVTTLEPDYAEGWSRSARLATEEGDLSRAYTEITQALIYEPRHFYALWTLGNIMERFEKHEEAYEAYLEANTLYPELKAVKDRVEMMRAQVEGDVL